MNKIVLELPHGFIKLAKIRNKVCCPGLGLEPHNVKRSCLGLYEADPPHTKLVPR
jgi:hypothetical protein